ncbi:hypothetical protein T02_308 [Trichinella nativa]|uniref:Uncharacterized protein n=1 Tax=Trichinella nativa TaxID=6335 RepID=A0A0V1L1J7_9BILA|nr:hypothetical protein T02_308 [Trichinella nativa]
MAILHCPFLHKELPGQSSFTEHLSEEGSEGGGGLEGSKQKISNDNLLIFNVKITMYVNVLSAGTAFAMHIPEMQACFLDSLHSLSVLHSPPTGFAELCEYVESINVREINNSNNVKVQKDDMVLFDLALTNSIEHI